LGVTARLCRFACEESSLVLFLLLPEEMNNNTLFLSRKKIKKEPCYPSKALPQLKSINQMNYYHLYVKFKKCLGKL
jgi:hypothetical protein